MSYETLLVEVRGPVGLITLNRPKALNALSGQTMDELTQALDALEEVAKATLPADIGYAWSNMSYQEKAASGQCTSWFNGWS